MSNKVGHTELKDALNAFRQLLTPVEYSELLKNSDLAASGVIEVTASLDRKKSKYGRKRILPFLESVHQFSAIVDTFIQTDPKISALVWGSVKFVIMVAMNFLSYFEKLAEMLEKLGFCCPVFDRIQQLYPDSVELCDAICAFYATAITFCTEALKFFKADGLRQFQKALWRPFKLQFSDIEQRLQDQSERIDRELAIASEKAACRERQVACLYRQEGHQHRTLQLKHWEESREWRIQQYALQEEERRKRLLNNLSDYDYTYTFLRARSLRHEGTGQWIVDTDEFQQWHRETRSSGFWCNGIPGSGKTIMTTGIIDYIFSHPDRRDSSMICYFFCDFASRRSLEIQTVLSSFVKQILNVFPITPELEEKLERHFGGVQRPPTMEQLFQILASSAQLPDITYFIVDGLDECSDNDKRRLLLYLKRLLGIRKRIKVLVSSRNEAEISRSLELFYKVSLDTPRTCSDIDIFVADKLQTKVEEGGLILQSSSMIDEIKETLVRKFDGMFLWVALQLDDICKENNDEDIRRALQSLPRGLNETYARILKRIVEYRKPDIAKKIINWVAGARRPLRLDELVEGVSFEVGDTYWQQGRSRFPASETRMLQNCENLITMTHTVDGDVLQVIHFTAFEFLLSQSSIAIGVDFHIHMREANKLIRGVCLTYLNLVDFETQVTSLPRSPMVSEIDMSPSGWIPWMMSSSIMRRTWSIAVRHLWPTYDTQPIDVREVLKLNTPTTPELPPETLEKQFRLLRYATEHWINHCSDLSPDIQDEESSWKSFANMTRNGRFPLPWDLDESCDNLPYAAQFRWSVRNGHVGLFRLTTDSIKATIGAYTKLDCGGGQTALYLSCSLGYEDIVRILLSLGIDLSAPSGDPTMLQVAAAGGHLAVVDQLLHAGADVNEPPVPPDTGRTALQAAAEEGHLDVVRRLLLAGARVNMPPAYRSGRTALQAATAGGHLTVVEHLLHAKADVNAPAVPFGQTALQAAAEGGHLAVVDRLLQAKAEVHTSTVYRGARTALQAAAAGGHLDMVDRLLQAEADVNDPAVPLGTGRTALQAAAGEGHLPVVQRLLHAKADVNAPAVEISGRTALQAAAEGGHLDVVNRLLQAGADVNILPAFRFGRTALQAAAGMGHLDMVNRLLQANADVNAPAVNISGRTALQAAAERGYLSVVDRLLEATANVNAPAACRSGRTALQAAAEGGYLHIVDRLLRAGADVNAPAVEDSGRTALQAAAERGHIDVVERLLRAGADVNAPAAEHDGLSALQAAELGEHMNVIGRLQRTAE